jgi:diguanylate cyclase (GGDEF)-like protein
MPEAGGERFSTAMRRLAAQAAERLLGADGRQRMRVLHHLISFGVMVVGVAGMLWLVQAGLAPTGPVAVWATLSLGGYAAIYAVLRSGRSRRYADPSLTLVQIVYCIVSCAVAYALSGPARGGVFAPLMIAVMFGMFRLAPRAVWWLGVFAVLLFSAVGLAMVHIQPQRYLVDVERVHLFVLVTLLPLVSIMGGCISRLRERERAQRVEIAQALERIRALADRDELTGLHNRRRINDLMEQEVQRSARGGHAFCLVLFDIDHFKRVNDTRGHLVGDEVLCAFARVAAQAIRRSDVLARWGGEEFTLLLPDTLRDTAVEVAERLRTQIEAAVLGTGENLLRVTVSAGVVERAPHEPLMSALERADRALYRAKEGGRNRVVVG